MSSLCSVAERPSSYFLRSVCHRRYAPTRSGRDRTRRQLKLSFESGCSRAQIKESLFFVHYSGCRLVIGANNHQTITQFVWDVWCQGQSNWLVSDISTAQHNCEFLKSTSNIEMLNQLLNIVFKFLNWWICSKVWSKVIHALLIVMLLYTLLETRPSPKSLLLLLCWSPSSYGR